MSNKINAIIKIRIDTIENWVINNPSIHENEQIIVKLSENKVGIKIGNGKTFNETPFISFESLNVNLLNNDGYNLSLPKENGTLVTSESLESTIDELMSRITELQDRINKLDTNGKSFSDAVLEVINSNYENAENTLY